VDLLYGYRGHPAAGDALWQKAEQALFDFKYWYTDPTPVRDGEKSVYIKYIGTAGTQVFAH